MVKKVKTFFSLVIVGCLILSMITACEGGSKGSVTEKTNSIATQKGVDKKIDEQEGSMDKKIKLSYFGYWCGDIVEDNFCEKMIEDALNIDLQTKKVNHQKKEQVDLMIASGDMPDMGWFDDYNVQYMYYDQELTRLIPVDLIRKYAPSFIKTYDKFPIMYKTVTCKEDKSQHYALSGHQAYMAGNQYFFANFYRKDWLDKFGIKPDSPMEEVVDRVYITEKGFTLDKFEEILKNFTTGDPDNNGKPDTTGMIGDNGFTFNWSPLLGAFGLVPGFSVNDNGKAVNYYSTERYKSFLKYVSKLYKQGYIDKEILTLDRQQFWEKAQMGYGGYFGVSANWLGTWAKGRPPLNILETNKESSILMTPGQIGPDGSMGTKMYSATPQMGWFYVNKDVKDKDKLIRILQFAEYTGYGKDKKILVYGEEGKDYDVINGNHVRKDGFVNGGARGIFTYSLFVQDEQMLDWTNDGMFLATKKYTLGPDGLWNKFLIKPYRYDLEQKTQLDQLNKEYGTNISDIVNEFFARAITGEVNIDAEWDSYIKKLNSAGYDKILEEMQKAPLYEELIKMN